MDQANDTMLIDTLAQQKVKGNWGDNNPKLRAWVVCIDALARSENEASGVCKTLTIVKSQWQKVHPGCACVCMYLR